MKVFLYLLIFFAGVILIPVLVVGIVGCSPLIFIYFLIDRFVSCYEKKNKVSKKEDPGVFTDFFNKYMNEKKSRGI